MKERPVMIRETTLLSCVIFQSFSLSLTERMSETLT